MICFSDSAIIESDPHYLGSNVLKLSPKYWTHFKGPGKMDFFSTEDYIKYRRLTVADSDGYIEIPCISETEMPGSVCLEIGDSSQSDKNNNIRLYVTKSRMHWNDPITELEIKKANLVRFEYDQEYQNIVMDLLDQGYQIWYDDESGRICQYEPMELPILQMMRAIRSMIQALQGL